VRYPDKTGRHEPYESRGSRADLWGPEAAMPPATRPTKAKRKGQSKAKGSNSVSSSRRGRR